MGVEWAKWRGFRFVVSAGNSGLDTAGMSFLPCVMWADKIGVRMGLVKGDGLCWYTKMQVFFY